VASCLESRGKRLLNIDNVKLRPVFLACLCLLIGTPAYADDIRVLSSVAVKSVFEALAPEFARATKHTVTPTFGIAAAIKTSIEGGAPFDIAILTPAMLDDLAAKGLVASPRPVVARAGLGLMIKAGASKPDVSSVDAFKRTLLAARGVTYVPTGASGVLFLTTVDKLGIGDAMKAKARPAATGDEVNAHIRNGTADLAVLPVSEILPVQGAELGGVFPAEIQSYIVMAAGINPRSSRASAASELVTFLTAAKNTPVVRAKGMER
jgi:molybdate transport system substrate-binding protein